MNEHIKIPKVYIDLLDQLFEIERKLNTIQESNTVIRNINKMKDVFENIFATPSGSNIGLTYHDPLGEEFNETRLDVDVSIAGESTKNLIITEVIKPIIRYKNGGSTIIARKGLVVVESK